MIKIIKFSNKILCRYSKQNFYFFSILSFFTSILNVSGVVSFYPIITYLFFPEKVLGNVAVKKILMSLNLQSENIFNLLIIIFLILIFASLILNLIIILYKEFICEDLIKKIKIKTYTSILNSDFNDIQKMNLSSYMNIETFHIGRIKTLIGSYLDLINNLFLFLFVFITICYFNIYFLILFLFLVLIFLINRKISKKIIINNSLKLKNLNQYFNSIYYSVFFGFKEIKLFNLSNKIIKGFKIKYQDWIKLSLVNYFFANSIRLFIDFSIFVILAYLVIFQKGLFTDPNNYSIISVMVLLFLRIIPVFNLMVRNMNYILAQHSSYEEIKKFLDFKRKKIAIKNKNINFMFKKQIAINNVKFDFKNGKKFNFNFNIKCGDKILFYGKSGCGKSTLLNIISGFYEPLVGGVFVDGINVKENLNNFIKKLSYISQQNLLFPGTILSNITFDKKLKFKDKLKLKKIYSICGLESFINYENLDRLHFDFNANILSGGQKQRIIIARALFINPKLLLLDEATNALDIISEKKVLAGVMKYLNKTTIIVVSHSKLNIKFDKKYLIE